MNDGQPIYYRVLLDTHQPEELYEIAATDNGCIHAPTDREVDPYDIGDDWYEEQAARATKGERAEWGRAYRTLTDGVKRAEDKLEAARAAWEQAQGVYCAALEDVWRGYASTDAAIAGRCGEVTAMRGERECQKREAEAHAAQEAQDREDAEFGPRTWVVFHPRRRGVKVAPDMLVPVIHLAGCKLTGGHEDLPYANDYQYARPSGVEEEEVLLAGAPRCSRGRPTDEMLPTRLCGRCRPQESLRTALGTVYESWKEGQDSVQEPMPVDKDIPVALNLKDEWRTRNNPGFTMTSSTYYRAENLIEPYESLIGWYYPDRNVVDSNPEALARLEEILPERGFAVRRIKQPAAFRVGDKESDTAVAVRRMTKAEIRQHKKK